MRLFLAIFPPKEYIKYFAEVFRVFDKEKRNLKPIPYDQVHLTLKFIGANVSQSSFEKITGIIKRFEGQYTRPEIIINKVQFGFERQTDPRYLIADIEPTDSLLALNNEIHSVIKSLKLRDTIRWKEKYSNDFHITFGFMKRTATRSSGKNITNLIESANSIIKPEKFFPETFEFMESELRPTGPKYKKILSIDL